MHKRSRKSLLDVQRWGFHSRPFHTNRKYKDRLFQRIFDTPQDLLELYNAVNDTQYTNWEDLEITTLEDAIYMSMKNDKSFIISSTLNLYEHQSTWNPNMPIRGLLYFARLYDAYIARNGFDIFGHAQVSLPFPQYIVFYNGEENCPEQCDLHLSDAFSQEFRHIQPAVECHAHVININRGHNHALMSRSHLLYEYSYFIGKVRDGLAQGLPLNHAIDSSINVCIEEGILSDFLVKNRAEVKGMLLTEFDEKKFARTMKKEGYEEGVKDGIREGIKEGIEEGQRQIILHVLQSHSPDETASILGLPLEQVLAIAEEQPR